MILYYDICDKISIFVYSRGQLNCLRHEVDGTLVSKHFIATNQRVSAAPPAYRSGTLQVAVNLSARVDGSSCLQNFVLKPLELG